MGKSLGNSGYGCTDRTLTNSGPSGGGHGALSQPATIYDSKSIGTSGGTFNSGSWILRDLNTVQSDPGGVATIATNQILLSAGSYVFMISCPAYAVGNHQARLYNVTSSTVVAEGSVETTSGLSVQTRSVIKCSTTVAVPTVFEVQHRCTITKTANGFGLSGGMSNEIYTVVQIWAAA